MLFEIDQQVAWVDPPPLAADTETFDASLTQQLAQMWFLYLKDLAACATVIRPSHSRRDLIASDINYYLPSRPIKQLIGGR